MSIRSATRIALSIGIGCASVVWVATSIGIIPNPDAEHVKVRIASARALAINVASYAERQQLGSLPRILESFTVHDDSIASIGVKRGDSSRYLMSFGPHAESWQVGEDNTQNQIGVEILANGRPWGHLEVAYANNNQSLGPMRLSFPIGLILFAFAGSSLFALLILSRSLRYLDPSNVVPGRVRSALDTLAEGLVLINPGGEIAHANEAFCEIVGAADKPNSILGLDLGSFAWATGSDDSKAKNPWQSCLIDGERVGRRILNLTGESGELRKFAVSATPIHSGDDKIRGVMVSFDDVTELESKNAELASTVTSLRSSRDEVATQNARLNFLASYDPLTKCMNRRAFLVEFNKFWADKNCKYLNLMILDVDFFKNINDTHGHSVGDEVLVTLGHLLRQSVGERGVVCRYGGEEFVILLPGVRVDQCESFANDLRMLVEKTVIRDVKFTTSIGVSCREFIPMDAQHLLDQADEALYLAKRTGRNKVVRFDQKTQHLESIDKAAIEEAKQESEVPYPAVMGLLSALSFRCSQTAQHSIRVADLSVTIGKDMMDRRELYRLEVSALLHDIGKIGVPDSILNKPGALNEAEWKLMRKHDKIAGEIVRNALSSEVIAKNIEHYYARDNETSSVTDTIVLAPLASRIIAVCDAFDAMTHDKLYRKAMPVSEALSELEKNAPGQFDAVVVKLLCEYVRSGKHEEAVSQEGKLVFSSKQASEIGRSVEQMYEAVSEQDMGRLKGIVQGLRYQKDIDQHLKDLTVRLDEAVDRSTKDDLDVVLDLINEVMQICRDSRSKFVDAAESIVRTVQPSDVVDAVLSDN